MTVWEVFFVRRIRLFAAFLLALSLLLSGCFDITLIPPSRTPPDTAAVTPIWQGIPLYGDVIETDRCGDLLQVAMWQSGLDTADGGIFLYNLSANVLCGELRLPAKSWATGCLKDGIYTVSLTDGTITLYNTACKPRLTWKLDTAFAFAQVSRDGEWLLYGNGQTSTVRLRRLKTGEEREVLTFSGYVETVAPRDNAFYICCGGEELLRIDPAKEYAEALIVDAALHRFTPYYCVGADEGSWHAVLADRPEEVLTLPTAGKKEDLLAAGQSGWLTVSAANKTTAVRLYRPYADVACATLQDTVLHALSTTEGALLITSQDRTASLCRFTPNDGVQPPDTSTRGGVRTLLEDVPILPQHPHFPTGCESVSAVMALQYVGEDVSVDTFIDRYLPCESDALVKKDGCYYGPNPYKVFVGDPRTISSFGCMAPVIERAVDAYFGNADRTVNTGGKSLEMLCEQYVANGIPVLTWVTIAMREVEYRTSWYTEDGEKFNWPGNEHCMVLVGYDAEKYYFNDPYLGLRVAYNRTLAEDRYYAMGCQSLVII